MGAEKDWKGWFEEGLESAKSVLFSVSILSILLFADHLYSCILLSGDCLAALLCHKRQRGIADPASRKLQHLVIHRFSVPASIARGFDRDEDISRTAARFEHTLLTSTLSHALSGELSSPPVSHIYTNLSLIQDVPFSLISLRAACQGLSANFSVIIHASAYQLCRRPSDPTKDIRA